MSLDIPFSPENGRRRKIPQSEGYLTKQEALKGISAVQFHAASGVVDRYERLEDAAREEKTMVAVEYVAVRLFGRPVALAVCSLAAYLTLAYWIPHQVAASPIFKPVSSLAEQYAGAVALAVLVCALLSALISGYQYRQWMSGGSLPALAVE